jgi:hypothetical protein
MYSYTQSSNELVDINDYMDSFQEHKDAFLFIIQNIKDMSEHIYINNNISPYIAYTCWGGGYDKYLYSMGMYYDTDDDDYDDYHDY